MKNLGCQKGNDLDYTIARTLCANYEIGGSQELHGQKEEELNLALILLAIDNTLMVCCIFGLMRLVEFQSCLVVECDSSLFWEKKVLARKSPFYE